MSQIKYHIGDTEYALVRYNQPAEPWYQVESVENGVRIAWHGHTFLLGTNIPNPSFRIYRSDVYGEKGLLIGENFLDREWDSSSERPIHSFAYEFIDTTAQPEQIYYYSLWETWDDVVVLNNLFGRVGFNASLVAGRSESNEPLKFGNYWQLRRVE